MYFMDNALAFWLFTVLFLFVSLFISRFLCDYCNYYPSERRYILFFNKDKEMMPIIKIENNNT